MREPFEVPIQCFQEFDWLPLVSKPGEDVSNKEAISNRVWIPISRQERAPPTHATSNWIFWFFPPKKILTKSSDVRVQILKALVNIVVDRLKKKVRTVLADLYNYVQVDE